MNALGAWAAAYAVTAVVEAPIYARALRPRAGALLLGALLSLPTHPLVFLALPRIWPGTYLGYVATAEALAVLGEAGLLALLRAPAPLAWSLAANAASTVVGLGLRSLAGWP